jgi:putative acetyltransferase
VDIKLDDLSGPEIAVFLEAHLQDMKATSPPESKHALDLEGLRQPEVTFWTVWEQGTLIGCGAIKALDADHGEIKSMRTAPTYRGRGVASRLLQHILQEARQRGYGRLSLETGSMVFFEPARRLYAKHGFEECPPFGDYWGDPNSVFMTRTL